jgi:hypothetical protein
MWWAPLCLVVSLRVRWYRSHPHAHTRPLLFCVMEQNSVMGNGVRMVGRVRTRTSNKLRGGVGVRVGCGNKELLQTSERSGAGGGWERGRRKRNLATAPTCLAGEGQGRAKGGGPSLPRHAGAFTSSGGVTPMHHTDRGWRAVHPAKGTGRTQGVGRPCDDGAVCDDLGLGRKTLPAAGRVTQPYAA